MSSSFHLQPDGTFGRPRTLNRNESILVDINSLFEDETDDKHSLKQSSIHSAQVKNDPPPLSRPAFISLCIVYFSVFLDMMGVSICQPIIPFYADLFNASPTQLGALYSSYSAMSFIASFFMGKFSDRWGRKPMILFSLFGTMSGFLLTGLAQNYDQLLACRFITGLFGATTPVAMASVTDVVPAKSRPKYLAAIGVSISMAFVIGPSIGAGLAEFSLRMPFFISSGLGGVGVLCAIFVLKESYPKSQRELAKKKSLQKQGSINSYKQNNKTKKSIPSQIWFLCIVYFLLTISWTVFQSQFGLYLMDEYDLASYQVGFITTAKAITAVFSNIVLFALLTKCMSMYIDMVLTTLVMGTALLLSPFMTNLYVFLVIFIAGVGFSFGQMLPGMNAMGAEYTTIKNRGVIMSIVSSAHNLGLVLGPIVHGELYEINNKYPFYLGAICGYSAFIVMISMICKWPQLRYKKDKRKTIIEQTEKDELGGSVITKQENDTDILLLEDIWDGDEEKYDLYDITEIDSKNKNKNKKNINIINVATTSYPFNIAYYINFDKTITEILPSNINVYTKSKEIIHKNLVNAIKMKEIDQIINLWKEID